MSTLRDALLLPRLLVSQRELLFSFVKRELQSRIEGSLLGRLWPVLQPMVLFAIYYLVFAQILKIGFSDDLAPHAPEMVGWRSTFYLITGILPWQALAESLTRGSGAVLENANLIKKIAFPSEILPTYNTLVYHVYFMVGFVILLLLEVIINGGLPMALLWFPAVLLVQFVFINGLAMFLSAANIFVRDVAQFVGVLTTFWMFTTPVFYDLKAVKKAADLDLAAGAAADKHEFIMNMSAVMEWNPMAGILDMYRSIFSYGRVEFPVQKLAILALVALVVQFLAYAFFLRCKGRFADEV
jgi:ABC-type polysaccharide/polyol phosphate export permease